MPYVPFQETIADDSSRLVTRHETLIHCPEPITHSEDNMVHFISSDCEAVTPVTRLLLSVGRIDLKELDDTKPKKGQVLVTPRKRTKTYTIVLNNRHSDRVTEKDIESGLINVKTVLKRDHIESFRISRYGNFSIEPSRNTLSDLTTAGHKGLTRTYRRIKSRFYWPNLRRDITEFIRRCPECAEQKLTRIKTREPMILTDTPLEVFDKVSLDTVGVLPTTPNGNRHILTIQDHLSKYCLAVAIPDSSANTIAHALATNLFAVYGAPKCILTDRGKAIVSTRGKEKRWVNAVFRLVQRQWALSRFRH
ncbi:protein NYNRIN-like [Leptopilina boulardi]|uniref:protein NYNRIN-like n=1 Tax=Leptopilina boulardi TaxID=63433 RepID=UPI0021F5FE42|nr:protein NYNRIN-like [Leptopilina boulardi]